MQNPTSEEGAILKREWWRKWTHDDVPQMQYVIQSYDTAYTKKETADYSAITTWCVFYPDENSARPALLLLDVKKGRWDFPELKRVAYEQFTYWDPDTIIVEAKASGLPLTDELRQAGIPVVNQAWCTSLRHVGRRNWSRNVRLFRLAITTIWWTQPHKH